MTKQYPVGIWCQNDVVSTSMRRNHVASTLIRRHFHVMCPLGSQFDFLFLYVYTRQVKVSSECSAFSPHKYQFKQPEKRMSSRRQI